MKPIKVLITIYLKKKKKDKLKPQVRPLSVSEGKHPLAFFLPLVEVHYCMIQLKRKPLFKNYKKWWLSFEVAFVGELSLLIL